jgi:hypothetical protein
MENESEDWKTICQLVANESDVLKISAHIKRLIQALDARAQTVSPTDASQKRADLAESQR